MPTPEVVRAAEHLVTAQRIAVLTGAGVSAESGVPTFRDANGLWEGHDVMSVASPMGFARDPLLVWRFYNQRRANLRTVQPNPGHFALVELEQFTPREFTLITQNVDGLHQVAGSRNVLEIHGSIRRVRCTECPHKADRGLEELSDEPPCPECGARLRPDIVWFYEMLPTTIWEAAERAVAQCDCFLVVGTSAVVYPAAGLIEFAKLQRHVTVIEVNREQTNASRLADVCLRGPSGELLPELLSLYKSHRQSNG